MSKKRREPKFKYTRELVRIANNDGMTQEEIARVCRVSQSVVSSWLNGKSKASEQQMRPLLKRYGARLNRTSARLYLVAEAYSRDKFERTELGRRSLALANPAPTNDEPDREPTEKEWPTIDQVRAVLRIPDHSHFVLDELRTFLMPTSLMRVEGPIVLRHTFTCPMLGTNARGEVTTLRFPIARWLVHHQSRDRFILVRQVRRFLMADDRAAWERIWGRIREWHKQVPPHLHQWRHGWLSSRDDAARWLSTLAGPLDAGNLLEYVDTYLADEFTRHDPHDEQVLPFLVRKTLLELGYHVPDVTHISSYDAVE